MDRQVRTQAGPGTGSLQGNSTRWGTIPEGRLPKRALRARGLDRKDVAAVKRHGGRLADTLSDLLDAAGPADRALEALQAAALPPAARELAVRLAEAVAAIRARAPMLRLTIDPVEFRGFHYETGVSVTIYAPGRHEELGRGGRYICGEAEPATGLTLFPDAVLRAAPRAGNGCRPRPTGGHTPRPCLPRLRR